MIYEYNATLRDVIDGDTVDMDLDLGFGIRQHHRMRLWGINAPEMKGVTAEKGKAARVHLLQLLTGKTLKVRTRKDKADKYGRYLAEIVVNETVNANEAMLRDGHAVEYMRDE